MSTGASDTPKPETQVIAPPVRASLLVPAAGVVLSALVMGLSMGVSGLASEATLLGLAPALVVSLFVPGAFLAMGPQVVSRFGMVAMGVSIGRTFLSLGGLLVIIVALDPQRPGLLVGFLTVAAGTLVVEKLVILRALQPAIDAPGVPDADRAGTGAESMRANA